MLYFFYFNITNKYKFPNYLKKYDLQNCVEVLISDPSVFCIKNKNIYFYLSVVALLVTRQ